MDSTQSEERPALTDEERTRYDALFFSQEPIDGLLAGEKACDLFLLSKLPLPVLSKIWHLVDMPQDNMLDHVEFANAVHLLRHNLRGGALPPSLPVPLQVRARAVHVIPHMNARECTAYTRLFHAAPRDWKGMIEAHTARDILLTSGLPRHVLAHAWNLSDVDRDARLSLEEFTLISHVIRYCKKGKKIGGPVNVQALLPDRLPRADLAAKKHRLNLLERRKVALMALREKRRDEATREGKRVELWAERLRILTAMHKALREEDTGSGDVTKSSDDVSKTSADTVLARHKKALTELQTVAHRLKRADEQVRQHTARVIIAEQKLSRDVATLQQEADKLRERSKRNSVIKDIDPFHQVYEKRKEERLTGVTSEAPSDDVIAPPPHLDPFSAESLNRVPLSGQQLFCVSESGEELDMSASPWSGSTDLATQSRDPFATTDPALMALTHAFDDNFVDAWAESGSDDRLAEVTNPGLAHLDDAFCSDGEQDAVFKTVSVTAEEDDLWSSLPNHAPHDVTSVTSLKRQLDDVTSQIQALNASHPQVVFRNPEDYTKYKDEASTTKPPSRQPPPPFLRRSSDSLLRHVTSSQSPRDVRRAGSYHGQGRHQKHEQNKDQTHHSKDSVTLVKTDIDSDERVQSLPSNLQKVKEEIQSPKRQKQDLFESLNETRSVSKCDIPSSNSDNTDVQSQSDPSTVEKDSIPPQLKEDLKINLDFLTENDSVPAEDSFTLVKTGAHDSDSEEQTTPPIDTFSAARDNETPLTFVNTVTTEDTKQNTSETVASISKQSEFQASGFESDFVTPSVQQSSKLEPSAESCSQKVTQSQETKQNISNTSAVDSQSGQVNINRATDTSTALRPSTLDFETTQSLQEHSVRPVQLRESNAQSRSKRALKAQTWHPQDSATPVPPPRRKSRKSGVTSPSSKLPSTVSSPGDVIAHHQILDRSISLQTGLALAEKDVFGNIGIDSNLRAQGSHSGSVSELQRHSPSKKRQAPVPPVTSTLTSPTTHTSNPLSPQSPTVQSQSSPSNPTLAENANVFLAKSLSSPGNAHVLIPAGSESPIPPPRTKRASKKKARGETPSSAKNPLFASLDNLSVTSDTSYASSVTPVTSAGRFNSNAGKSKSIDDLTSDSISDFSHIDVITQKQEQKDFKNLGVETNLNFDSTRVIHSRSDSADSGIISPALTSQSSPQHGSDHVLNDPDRSNLIDSLHSSDLLKNIEQSKSSPKAKQPNSVQLCEVDLLLGQGVNNEHIVNTNEIPLQHTEPVELLCNPQKDINTRYDSGFDIKSNEEDFKKELESLFDQVSADDFGFEVDRSLTQDNTHLNLQVLNKDTPQATSTSDNELTVKNDQQSRKELVASSLNGNTESISSQPKGTSSDYFSQSDCSVIDDDMESVAKKQELDKLRKLYFGGGAGKSASTNVSPRSPVSPTTPPASTLPQEDIIVVLDDSTKCDGWKKKYYNRTSLDIEGNKSKEPIEDTSAPTLNSDQDDVGLNLDLNSNKSVESRHKTVLDNAQLTNESISKYMKDHVIVKEELQIGLRTNFIDPAQQIISTQDHYDSDDSNAKFEATFDPRSPANNRSVTSPRDSDDVTLLSYQSTPQSPRNIVPLRKDTSMELSPTSPENVEIKWTFNSSKTEAPPLPSSAPPPLPFNPPPPSSQQQQQGISLTRNLEDDSFTHTDRAKGIYTSDTTTPSKAQWSEKKAFDSSAGSEPTTGEGGSNSANNSTAKNTRSVTSYAKYGKGSVKSHSGTQPLEGTAQNVRDPTPSRPVSGATGSTAVPSSGAYWDQQLDPDSKGSEGFGVIRTSVSVNNVDSKDNRSLLLGDLNATTSQDSAIFSWDSSEKVTSPTSEGKAMDPVTGLRRTQASTPMEKAMRFVQASEPSFRVKKLSDTDIYDDEEDRKHLTGLKTRAQEIEQERAEIMDEMRMRKKTLTSWVETGSEEIVEGEGENVDKSASERQYEERKRRQETLSAQAQQRAPVSPPVNQNQPSYEVSSADIDSRSLTDNKQSTIRELENKFSSPDTQLYPKSPPVLTPQRTPTLASNTQNIVSPVIKATDYSDVTNKSRDHESAIEREIRLAQEREAELKRERARLIAQVQENERELKVVADSTQFESAHKMPIHKIPAHSPTGSSSSGGATKANASKLHHGGSQGSEQFRSQSQPAQPYREMTEVDRDVMKRESIIEREIREQLAREEELKHQALSPRSQANSKEAEQSEFERSEKERERIRAHESIIEREIREQKEREREVVRIRKAKESSSATSPTANYSAPVTHNQTATTPSLPKSTPPPAVNKSQRQQYSSESESERESHHSFDPSTGRVDSHITYVDAIAGATHKGESMIARELREQREREEELRSQWKAAGRDVPLVTLEPSDTPFNQPDLNPSPMRHTHQMTQNSAPRRRSSLDSSSSAATENSLLNDHPGVVQSTPQRNKVQPFQSSDDEEDSNQYRFVPMSETPVEKEIRIAREREEALRAEKGLPSNSSFEDQQVVIIDSPGSRGLVVSSKGGPARRPSESDHASMKRFASGRLQQEMIKDKQREVELKSSGIITTLSEERVGELMSYKDHIHKDTETGSAPVPNTPYYVEAVMSKPKATQAQPKQPQQPPQQQQQQKQSAAADQLDSAPKQNGMAPKQSTQTKQVSSSQAYSPPPQSMNAHARGSQPVKSGAASAETMIERELREQREREEELRRQRGMLRSGQKQATVLPPRDDDVIDDAPTLARLSHSQSDDVTLRNSQNGGGASQESRAKRKSALAEQWEKSLSSNS